MFTIDFPALYESLPYMAKGMLGIFVVTLVIVGAVSLLNLLTDLPKAKDSK